MRVGLINYGRGNLHSVNKALERLHCEVEWLENGRDITDQDALVLPGVGAFGDAMQNLAEREFVAPIQAWVKADQPLLGICVGCQLLFDDGEESPGVKGLGLIRGSVVKFPATVGKIPHMGWNQVEVGNAGRKLFAGISDPYFYHVHSYFPQVKDSSLVACWTEYEGVRFASGVVSGHLAAFQFHPEKSQQAGLRLIGNYLQQCLA